MINERIEDRLYHYISHKIIETPRARFHAIGGIETHIDIATSLQPNILVSDWIGKLKGSSSYYINHEVQPKALEWQRGYGIVTFGTKDVHWVMIKSTIKRNTTKTALLVNDWRSIHMMTAKAQTEKDVKTSFKR